MNLTGIHVFKGVDEKSYSEHILLIQLISAMAWKKNGPIHLYTTKKDYRFFRAMGIHKIYDHIDTEVLEQEDEIYWPHFGAASKMKVLNSIQEFPVAFIDNDLIYPELLDESILDYDITFLHDEGRFWRNYPKLELLGTREGYQFPNIPELQTCNPINVGFFVMNNKELKERYCELAIDYMNNNEGLSSRVKWADKDLRKFWKPLFVEQRLLSAVVDNGNYTKNQLFPYQYYGDTCNWESKITGERITSKELFKKENFKWFHLWGEKVAYKKPEFQSLKIIMFYNLLNKIFKSGDPIAINAAHSVIKWLRTSNPNSEYKIWN